MPVMLTCYKCVRCTAFLQLSRSRISEYLLLEPHYVYINESKNRMFLKQPQPEPVICDHYRSIVIPVICDWLQTCLSVECRLKNGVRKEKQ